MAQFKRIFYQDLTKRRIIHHCEDVVFGGDNLSDKIGVYLYDNGEPYAGGGTVSGTVINSRGQTVPITTGEISGNLVTVTLEEAALAVPGIIGVYVKLTSGQQIATVLSAMFTAMPTETDQTIDPGTIIPSVSQLITDIQTAVDSIPAEYTELLAAVAPTFSASTAYTAGSYVWQGGSLYRFTADHPAGTWTGTDAVQVSLADDLGQQVSDLKSAINVLETDGENVYHTFPDGTESKKVKFADGCIVGGFYNTEPLIDIYDKGMSGANLGNKTGACITKLYSVNPQHTYTIYRACAGFSFNGYYDSQKFKDDVYVRSTSTPSIQNTVQTINFSNNDKSSESGINQMRFTLVTAQVKDSYMYDDITGEVIFAGKNTQYYGKRFIDGHFTESTILTDHNLNDQQLGLIIGKDGKVHLSQNELAVSGNGIKLADNAIESALYETKPRIAEYGVKGYGDDVRDTYAPTCITAKYKLLAGKTHIVVYQAVASGVSISWNGRNVVSYYNGNTYLGYVSITGNMNTEHDIGPTSAIAKGNPDSFFINLVTDSIDDSYAYEPDTGYIYFAGKNTPYYGLKNIYDATPETGLSATIEIIDGSIQYSRNGSVDMIPLFLTTDQHSASVGTVMEIFLRHASMDAVSKILNLGDTVSDHWIDVDPEKPLWECKQLADYAKQTANIPNDKRIDVIGNHDTWYIPDGGTIRWTNPLNHLYKYFRNPTAHYHDNHSNFTVVDPRYNVKYMVVAGYEYSGELTDYTGYKISSASLDWMIEEMSRDDGYDIIILSHQPLGANGTTYHNPVANNDFTIHSIAVYDYSSLWVARKNKTSGTITDASGVTHSYDFTGCKTDLICGLHGHEHKDGVAYIGDSLCDLIFHTFSSSDRIAYYFVIDRTNQQVNVWRISTSNNTYTNYQLPLVKPE